MNGYFLNILYKTFILFSSDRVVGRKMDNKKFVFDVVNGVFSCLATINQLWSFNQLIGVFEVS